MGRAGKRPQPNAKGLFLVSRNRTSLTAWGTAWGFGTLFLAFVFAAAIGEVGHAQTPNYAFSQAYTFAQTVRSDKDKRQLRHYWLRAIDRLQNVVGSFPGSRQAAQSQYLIGELYADMAEVSRISDDVDSAIAAYRLVVKNYPNDRLADDAQYAIGNLFLKKKGDRTGAYGEFERVLTLYPRGDKAVEARERLKELADAKPAPSISGRGLVNVRQILHWSNPDNTRVAIYAGDKTRFKYGLLPADKEAGRPRRLYIDILNARLDPGLKDTIPIDDGLLVRARAAQFSPDTVRVVLDIQSLSDYRIFPLMSPYRIIVDVNGVPAAPVPKPDVSVDRLQALLNDIKDKPEPEPVLRAEKGDNPSIPLTAQLGLQIRRIVIDAGHGGHDPGAIGVNKIYEKHIALNIARAVAGKLRERLGVETVLTRDNDTFIELEGRPGIARAKRGDLFISIHANAAASPNAFGIETYHLDLSSDKSAVAVAARENASSEATVSEQEDILRDLVLTSKKNDSVQLARAVQSSMIKSLSSKYEGVRDLGVKGAPFVVLIGANVPAVLIETGFVSNPREAKRLQDKRYVEMLADSIALGVGDYVKQLRVTTF